jgi:uncharacterized protein
MSTEWIQTYSGRKFYSITPHADDVILEDIAHALSLLCRFNGHCLGFYSVAEHSVRVSRILPDELKLWGLLHDAGEAYTTDLPRPVKAHLPDFRTIEDRVLKVVAEHFNLPWPVPEAVFDADTKLLATEARDLMAPAPEPWNLGVEPLAEKIIPLPPSEAEQLFLDEFARLT